MDGPLPSSAAGLSGGRKHTCSPPSAGGGGRRPLRSGAVGVWRPGGGPELRARCRRARGGQCAVLVTAPGTRAASLRRPARPAASPHPAQATCRWARGGTSGRGGRRVQVSATSTCPSPWASGLAPSPSSRTCGQESCIVSPVRGGVSLPAGPAPPPPPPASGFSLQPPGPWPQKAALGSRRPETRHQSTRLNSLNPVNPPPGRDLAGPRGNVLSCARQLEANSIGLGLFICAWIC